MKLATLGVALVLLVAGCGGTTSSTAHGAPATHHTKAAAPHDGPACRKALHALLAAETQLDDRLQVGLQFADYNSRVGDASVAYHRSVTALNQGRVSPRCVNRVGLPLQRALNDYTSAGTVWNNCIQDAYCSFGKGSAALKKAQAKWAKASVAIESAQSGLAGLG